MGTLNRVPALIGCGKGRNVSSAGWQATLCDPIWYVSPVAVRLVAHCYTWLLTYLLTLVKNVLE